MRIIIFSDSMARARLDLDEKSKTIYDEVYTILLRQKLLGKAEVDLVQIESLDTDEASKIVNPYVSYKNPDIVIFNIGLNDCAPRVFKKRSLISKVIYDNKFFIKITFNIFNKIIYRYRYFFTRINKKVYVNAGNFELNYKHMIEEVKKYNPNCKFYAISILGPSLFLEKKSYGIGTNILKYNNILKEIFLNNFIDTNDIAIDNKFIFDGIHMTKEMHYEVFQLIYKTIKEEIQCAE